MSQETREVRLRRMHMRSIRRGIKEMDLILTRYAETRMLELGPAELDLYDALLAENDQDLYLWVSGQAEPPSLLAALIEDVRVTAFGGEINRV